MHDPMTVAFEIKYPWKSRPSKHYPEGYRGTFITIWHRDPEKDGSDDSCDWFGGDNWSPSVLEQIRSTFLFEGRDGASMSWFSDDDYGPDLMGVGLSMFRVAANEHFGYWSRRARRFLQDNCFDILHFIDNGCDSINSSIRRANASSGKDREEILRHLALVVYSWILRRERPWWKHPRWHVHHWRLQVHPLQALKRRFWDRCCKCGKRGFPPGVSAIGSWDGDRIWHSTCADSAKVPSQVRP